MTLQVKTILLIAVVLFGLFGAVFLIAQLILLPSYLNLEQQDARNNVTRAQSALSEQLTALNSKAGDWANWDDAYDYVQNVNPDFIKINATDTTFVQLQLNVLVFIQPSGKIVYARGFNLQAQHQAPVSPALSRYFANPKLRSTLLRNDPSDKGLIGALDLPEGPMLIAARPILTSEGKGPSRGTLIFGRNLDQAAMERLSENIQLPITIYPLGALDAPEDARAVRALLEQQTASVTQTIGDETIAGYALVSDVFGRPLLLLRVDQPREIYAQGWMTIRYFLAALLAAGLMFSIATYMLVNRMALASSARQAAEEKTLQNERSLSMLNQLARSAASALEIQTMLPMLAEELRDLLNADTCYIALWDEAQQRAIPTMASGALGEIYSRLEVRRDERTMTECSLRAGRTLIAEDVFNSPYLSRRIAEYFPTRSMLAVPLIAGNRKLGAALVGFNRPHRFDPEELARAHKAAGPAALAVAKAMLFDDLRQSHAALSAAYETTLEGWARALELRDNETEGHSRRVTEMTLRVARAMGFTAEELVHVRRGALLHDIGKMGIPDQILFKPGPLNDQEWVIMRQHPGYAYDLLLPVEFLKPALDIPYCHHEKWDGTGYPRRLRGEEIPLAARIFAAVDIWDALRFDRPYRAAWSEVRVHAYLREQAGKHLDPQVVDAFLAIVENEPSDAPESLRLPLALTLERRMSVPI